MHPRSLVSPVRSLLAALMLAALPAALAAQGPVRLTPVDQEAVYVELGGSGLLYSVNYDRHLSESWTGRVGLGVLGGLAVPVTASYLMGTGDGRLELGAGAVFLSAPGEFEEELDEDLDTVLGTAIVGYRYQPAGGGLMFRVAFTPLFTASGLGLPWAGVSVGYAVR